MSKETAPKRVLERTVCKCKKVGCQRSDVCPCIVNEMSSNDACICMSGDGCENSLKVSFDIYSSDEDDDM